MKQPLTIELLREEAAKFAEVETSHDEPALYGVTDGKAVGTYLEHKFMDYLTNQYAYAAGNSASGIDFPDLGVDLKVTSIRQPQSSCPYKAARQKIYGLGYNLLVFVYERTWNYLQKHKVFLDKRGSTIYRNRPPFSIFGTGSYAFAPWKVAISGFYKKLDFKVVGPVRNRPAMLDDTIYFLPCESRGEASFLSEILNSEPAREFLRSMVFWAEKRPITVELLRKLDIKAFLILVTAGAPSRRLLEGIGLTLAALFGLRRVPS